MSVPVLDGAEGVFDQAGPLAHGIGDGGKALAGTRDDLLIDTDEKFTKGAFGAFLSCGACLAGCGVRVSSEPAAGLACGTVVPAGEDFSLWAGVSVARGIVDEGVAFIEAIGLSSGDLDGRQDNCAVGLAGSEMGTVAVAAVGEDGERSVGGQTEIFLGLLGDGIKRLMIVSFLGDLDGTDEVVLVDDGGLDVVADGGLATLA